MPLIMLEVLIVELLDMYLRLKSAAAGAHHFNLNWCSIKITLEKENVCVYIFLEKKIVKQLPFYLVLKVQDCHKKGILIDSNMI